MACTKDPAAVKAFLRSQPVWLKKRPMWKRAMFHGVGYWRTCRRCGLGRFLSLRMVLSMVTA